MSKNINNKATNQRSLKVLVLFIFLVIAVAFFYFLYSKRSLQTDVSPVLILLSMTDLFEVLLSLQTTIPSAALKKPIRQSYAAQVSIRTRKLFS